jgi:ATP-binding cassette subfamily B (MDR/TAP) protein 1
MSRQPSYEPPNLASGPGSFDNLSSNKMSHGHEKDDRLSVVRSRNRTPAQKLEDELKTDLEIVPHLSPYAVKETPVRGLFGLLRYYFPTIPQKLLVIVGLVSAIAHGISTPIWSFFLAKLMAIVGAGGTDPGLTKWGLVLLALSAAQGVVYWIQEYTLFCIGAKWSGIVRTAAFGRVLQQDKGWFDESANSPARLVQNLIKDADDMRQIIGSVMGKIVVFISMVGLGIIWALVVDWRLTLVGIALAPVFAVMMVVQDTLIGKAEVANKRRREDLARTFYDVGASAHRSKMTDLTERFQCAGDQSHGAGRYVQEAVHVGRRACDADWEQGSLVCGYWDRRRSVHASVRAG